MFSPFSTSYPIGDDRNKNREMLAQINAAYSDELDATEQVLRNKVRRQHRHMVEGEW